MQRVLLGLRLSTVPVRRRHGEDQVLLSGAQHSQNETAPPNASMLVTLVNYMSQSKKFGCALASNTRNPYDWENTPHDALGQPPRRRRGRRHAARATIGRRLDERHERPALDNYEKEALRGRRRPHEY